jgi:hypothetical protein
MLCTDLSFERVSKLRGQFGQSQDKAGVEEDPSLGSSSDCPSELSSLGSPRVITSEEAPEWTVGDSTAFLL